tara:strand:+ start:326 stop:556 length:231 start_codon:yes stop_codon:yes gene_type:complete
MSFDRTNVQSDEVIYRPIKTINTAGAIIPIRGMKTEGSQVAAKSLDILITNNPLLFYVLLDHSSHMNPIGDIKVQS